MNPYLIACYCSLFFLIYYFENIRFTSLIAAKSGVTDYYAVDDEHAIYLARQSIKNLNRVKDPQVSIMAPREPLYDPEELYGIVGDNLKKVSVKDQRVYTKEKALGKYIEKKRQTKGTKKKQQQNASFRKLDKSLRSEVKKLPLKKK